MNRTKLAWLFGGTILLLIAMPALAKRVNHDVNPTNIDKLPFTATVKVKDVGQLREFEITVKGTWVNPVRTSAASGGVTVAGTDSTAWPKVKRVEQNGVITFTFQISTEQLQHAWFKFVEDADDWNRPFPVHGEYYQFDLKEFARNAKK
jgi:hypothetical protein